MARRYVRDKIGRFASHGGGGGSFGGGGKVGKSAKNVKARAAYKNQAGKLREAKKMAKGRMTTKREQKYWNQQLGGAKSGMTRVSNRLTGRGAAKAKRGAANPNKLASSKKFAAARKAPKGSAVRKDAVASAKIRRGERRAKAEIRKGAKARSSYKPKQEAKQAKERILKKTKAKRMAAGGMKTPKGKISKTKPSAAKKEYKQQMGKARTLRKNVRVAPKDAARNYKREANIIEGRMKNKYGGKKGRSKISKAERNPAKNMYKKATSNLRFEKRVGLESGSKNTKSIKASQKAVQDLEKVFKNIKGKKG